MHLDTFNFHANFSRKPSSLESQKQAYIHLFHHISS